MSYSRSKKETDQEKKYQILKRQLFGKEVISQTKISKSNFTEQPPSNNLPTDAKTSNKPLNQITESNFLRSELTKITFLAGLIILAQVGLYFAIKINLVHF